jgi:hypothetical protein
MPTRDRRELETVVRLYEPAIPQTPAVRAEDIPSALALFPAGMPKPDLAGIDLRRHVAPEIATATASRTTPARAWAIVLLVALVVGVGAVLAIRRKQSRSDGPGPTLR